MQCLLDICKIYVDICMWICTNYVLDYNVPPFIKLLFIIFYDEPISHVNTSEIIDIIILMLY